MTFARRHPSLPAAAAPTPCTVCGSFNFRSQSAVTWLIWSSRRPPPVKSSRPLTRCTSALGTLKSTQPWQPSALRQPKLTNLRTRLRLQQSAHPSHQGTGEEEIGAPANSVVPEVNEAKVKGGAPATHQTHHPAVVTTTSGLATKAGTVCPPSHVHGRTNAPPALRRRTRLQNETSTSPAK